MIRLVCPAVSAIFVLTALLVVAPAAQADGGYYPIKAEDGSPVANHRIPAELESAIEKMADVVVAANPKGKVTLYEFYDLNCPYCRKASNDIDELVRVNRELRLVLVPFAVLGIPSILAARVEYGVARVATPQQFYEFHRLMFSGRGVVDDKRAFEAAQKVGLDMAKVRAIANEDAFGKVMTAHVRLGDALQIQATPGFVIGGTVIVGYPGKAALKKAVASMQRCRKVVCGH